MVDTGDATAPPPVRSAGTTGGSGAVTRPPGRSRTATRPSAPPRPNATAPAAGRSGRARRHRPGLDGMRAVAVAAVVAYHLAPDGLVRGGFFGVDVFFVISGYLITSLLAAERADKGRIGLVPFWRRRIRRLYPAVLTMIAVVIAVGALADPGAVAAARVTVPAALIYLTNWWFVYHRVPYFQAIGPPPLFIHLWSLAIEEQYYLLWPPVLAVLLARGRRPTRIAAWTLVAAVASTVLMAVLYHAGGSVDRIYYGSDTHAQGLLVGSALGLVVPPGRLRRDVTTGARRLIDGAGLTALAGLAVMMVVCSQSTAFTWRGGMLLVAALSGVAVVVAAHPASRLGLLLGTRPLRWLGTRSYSVYLWHWPVIDLTRPGAGLDPGGPARLVVRLALIAAASELSYRLVERPWRTGTAQARIRGWRSQAGRTRTVSFAATGLVTATVVGLLLTVDGPPPPSSLRIGRTAAAAEPIVPVPATTTPPVTAGGTGRPVRRHRVLLGSGPVPLTTPTTAAAPPPDTTSTVAPAADGVPALDAAPPGPPVLAIGDSVMLAASADLDLAFGPDIRVDAAVGRQVATGLSRLAAYRAAGRLDGLRALVVGLGTNGPFEPSQLAQLLTLARGVPEVVLINVRVPQPWQGESDATIDGAGVGHPQVRVVDWYDASAAASLLYPDAIHPDPAGQAVYSNLVVGAVGGDGADRG
jgi:peptidoglycan/LPS O-acetylase OafA/YrhL